MFNKILDKLGLRKEEIKILVPKELDKEHYIGGVRDFHKIGKTFKRGELTPIHGGRIVRYWSQVYKAEKVTEDLFIPVFWKVAKKPVKKDHFLHDF
jgi:hypothetical protein